MSSISDNEPENSRNTAGGAIRTRTKQGRESKACLECRKLKVRCDLFTGERKCRYCQRRDLACVTNRTYTTQVRDGQPGESEESRKIDALREEIHIIKGALDAVLDRFPLQEKPVLGQATNKSQLVGDNTQMAMARENSLEPAIGDGNEPVTLEESMGSLYTVTRLRNVRRNKAKTASPSPGTTGELDDFISKGVISQTEVEELYRVF
ncbi:Zn(II)2Cys6 transcription factor domain-containing protein [Aspergillus undulatus]|uniref:Zn(II)2Cys6 transcription factor domain-containing protein n=1 Tax=Aspergillus undulatus TaxID=1810928 RepID=UPI003CCE0D04